MDPTFSVYKPNWGSKMKFLRRASFMWPSLPLGLYLPIFYYKKSASRVLDELLTHINDTQIISLDDYILPELVRIPSSGS